MKECKSCGAILTTLIYTYSKQGDGTLQSDGRGGVEFDDNFDLFEEVDYKYYCPECETLITTESDEAATIIEENNL